MDGVKHDCGCALRFVQNRSLRRSDGVIFLTRCHSQVIQEYCGSLDNVCYIPHTVSEETFLR